MQRRLAVEEDDVAYLSWTAGQVRTSTPPPGEEGGELVGREEVGESRGDEQIGRRARRALESPRLRERLRCGERSLRCAPAGAQLRFLYEGLVPCVQPPPRRKMDPAGKLSCVARHARLPHALEARAEAATARLWRKRPWRFVATGSGLTC